MIRKLRRHSSKEVKVRMIRSFRGGIHPEHFKRATADLPTRSALSPARVAVLMQQHIGAPCEPLVCVGDKVKVGQRIGDSKGFVSAPVHASVSGEVAEIREYPHPGGKPAKAVVIESDGLFELHEGVKPQPDLESLSPDDLRQIIREAGIVGMGGAAFPTHVKLSPPPDKPIDTVIINGAECEPFLTADHRLMLERPAAVIFGLKVFLKLLGLKKGFIGVEDNKPGCIEALKEAAQDDAAIEVCSLKTKYPQGAEKQLIKVFTGREVPPGGLPMDVGALVQNTGTAAAVADALQKGLPTIDRIVTVTGPGVVSPANLLVKVGTMVSEIVEQCGGLKDNARKIILGGPMMGLAQAGMDMPVIKGTSGILVLTDEEVVMHEVKACIRCGRCVEACPMNLLPNMLGSAAEMGLLDKAEAFYATDCIECGCCAYVCPAKRPLTQWIRMAKGEILAKKRS